MFDGIKMGATVLVNGVTLGTVTDQFLRTEFPLSASGVVLRAGVGANAIQVVFNTTTCVDGRYMACTGAYLCVRSCVWIVWPGTLIGTPVQVAGTGLRSPIRSSRQSVVASKRSPRAFGNLCTW